MPSHALPDPLTKQDTSTKEYGMHEECTPQPPSTSHFPEDTTGTMHPQDEDMQDPARRRAKARSSSMYEEWKAHALRNDSSGIAAPVVIEKEEKPKKHNERAEKQASAQEGRSGDGKSQRQRRGSTAGRGRRQSNANRENNGNRDNRDNANRDRTPSTKRDDNFGPSEPESRRHKGYTTPNGTYFSLRELAKLSRGLKIPNGDNVYFRPSFVEDPWKDMTAIKTHCLSRY